MSLELAVNMESYARLVRAGELDAAGYVRECSEMGIHAVELMDVLIADSDIPGIIQAVNESASRVCAYDVHCDLVNPDRFIREGEIAKARVALRRAAEFRSPLAQIIPGVIAEGVPPSDARNWYEEALRASVDAANHLGIRLVVENIGMAEMAVYCGTSDDVNTICRRVGGEIGAVYDVGNYIMSGEDPIQAMAKLVPPIVHVHFKDWRIAGPTDVDRHQSYLGLDGRHYVGMVLGEGIVDLKGALGRLQERGYTGCISIEYEGPGRPDVSMRQAVSYLRGLVN